MLENLFFLVLIFSYLAIGCVVVLGIDFGLYCLFDWSPMIALEKLLYGDNRK